MEKVIKSVEVAKSGDDVMQGLISVVKAVKANHKAGGNLLVEVSGDILAALQALAPILGEIPQVPADAVVDRKAMLVALELGADDLVEAVLS